MLSGSSCVRRASSNGVKSAPPPNQALLVTTKRVFMCTAGTCGFCGCAINEMPEAQKFGFSAAPGISLRNSGANSPCTVEQCTPTFSNTRPRISAMTPPPPGSALADPALVPISGKPEIGCCRYGRCVSRACGRSGRQRCRRAAPISAARPRPPRKPRKCRRAGFRTRRARGSCGFRCRCSRTTHSASSFSSSQTFIKD